MTLNSIRLDRAADFRLTGLALRAAHLVWAAVFLLSVGVFVIGLPYRYSQLLSDEDEIAEGLLRLGYSPQAVEQYGAEEAMGAVIAQLGLSKAGYAAVTVILEGGVALVYIAVALVIFWRKSDSVMGLFASLFLIAFGVGGSSFLLIPFQIGHPAGFFVVAAVATVAYASLPLFFFLFPDGRLVPRWGWALAAAWAVTTFFWNFLPGSPLNPTAWPMGAYYLYLALVWGIPVLAQVYRYRRISNAAQRQQTKWLVLGFGWMVLVLLPPYFVLPSLLPGVLPETIYSILLPVQTIAMSIIPIALAISILRYRLWDIDLIIRRTLTYSLISAVLGLAYFGSVVVLQGVLRAVTGQAQSQLAAVVSTLGIAALFIPLRARVQAAIDRRFYRKKYDAARTLADFATAARDEVNLDALNARLVRVVTETVQPERVGLWLKPAGGRSPKAQDENG